MNVELWFKFPAVGFMLKIGNVAGDEIPLPLMQRPLRTNIIMPVLFEPLNRYFYASVQIRGRTTEKLDVADAQVTFLQTACSNETNTPAV